MKPRIPAFVLLTLAVAGCASEHLPSSNQAPTVTLSPEPVEGDTVSYHITISWTGADPDGRVTGYQYAVDPPAEFTEAEIAGGGDGIVTLEIPGRNGDPDTTRVQKVSGSAVVSFDWIHTPDASHLFLFSATRADSEAIGSVKRPTGRFTGMHAVYVRAVDDQGAFSVPAHVAFTASTIAPSASIAYPHYGSSALTVGATIQVEAEGTDPDGGGAPPVGYYYRIVRVDRLPPDIVPGQLWAPAADDPGWVFAAGPDFQRSFPLTPGNSYAVGIRAVDVAGAVEPFLDLGRNVILFEASSEAPTPVVTISEPALGTFTFPGVAKPGPEVTTARVALHFTVSCSAEEYGGDCDAMRWGLDVRDLEQPEDWSAWEPVGALPPLTLPNVATHVLYFQVRDTRGGVTTGYLLFHVTDTPMDRAALFVDDFRNQYSPYYPSDDATVDAWYKQLADDSGRFPGTSVNDSLWTYNGYGLNDVQHLPPIPPDLGYLGRFRLLIWYASPGYGGQSALRDLTGLQNQALASYLTAGGQLWLLGDQTVAAMMHDGYGGPSAYPVAPVPGDFAYDFMKLASGRIENTGTSPGQSGNRMIGVDPYPDRAAVYPAMAADTTRWSPFQSALIFPDADVVIDPIDATTIPDFPATGKIDSLYVYRAKDSSSPYEGGLTAIRYRDLDPNRARGSTQWFGFDMYWMRKDQAQEVFNRTIDWFRRESRP